MEEKKGEKDVLSAAFPWWSDSHSHLHQSQWLQAAHSDLDKKTKMIINLIQYDGESFAERAEMFYKSRPELIKKVQDLHKSYRSLAEKYDQLRSDCIHTARMRSASSSLNSSERVEFLENCNKVNVESTKLEPPTSYPESVAVETLTSGIGIDSSKKLLNESMSSKESNSVKIKPEIDANLNGRMFDNNLELDGNIVGDFPVDGSEREKLRNELSLKVSKLIEDNLRQQTELIRRNDEKREVIKHLRSQINRLMDENRALKSCLPGYKVDMKRSQFYVSKLKGLNCIRKFQE